MVYPGGGGSGGGGGRVLVMAAVKVTAFVRVVVVRVVEALY